MQAPHINVGVFARGILRRMFTRIYFEDEAANDGDAILALVPEDRRATLIARRDGTANGAPRYVFDVRLAGRRRDGVLRGVRQRSCNPRSCRQALPGNAFVFFPPQLDS